MSKARDSLGVARRWEILNRDDFVCAFCGARPGNTLLRAAHLIPHAWGGTTHDNNLVTACERCNTGMADRIAIPKAIRTDEIVDGWLVWKRWGKWILVYPTSADACVLTFEPFDYWISHDRWHEQDWHDHIRDKDFVCVGDGWDENGDRVPRPAPDRSRPLFDIDAADLLAREPSSILTLPPNKNWFDFCDAMTFVRTLVVRRRS